MIFQQKIILFLFLIASILVYVGIYDTYEPVGGSVIHLTSARNSPTVFFPANTSYPFVYPPSLADIDSDNDMDVVASNRVGIYAWEGSGTPLAGWPYLMGPPYQFYFAPSLQDIDNDQKLEIFGGAESKQQLGLSYNGNPLPGWPQQAAGGNSFNHPSAVGDVDGDGDYEIVDGTRDIHLVYVWNHDGSVHSGWPQNVEGKYVRSIAVADLDHDGDLEIIAADGLKIFVWNHDGTPYGPWPLAAQPQIQNLTSSGTFQNNPIGVATGDVDGDGKPNIVVFTYNFDLFVSLKRIWVHAFNADGTELPNFPVEISGLSAEFRPGIALGDLDHDNLLEIIVTTTWKLVVVKASGIVQSFPQTFPTPFGGIRGAVVANIDNDLEMEIISSMLVDNTLGSPQDGSGEIYAWNFDGSILAEYPLRLPVTPTTMLSIADIDGDGQPEVAGGYVTYDSFGSYVNSSGIYIQKLPGSSLGRVEWGTFAHDIRHTNSHS